MTDHLASFKERKNLEETNSDDVDRRLIELSSLFEISQTLNSSLNLQSILNNILLVPVIDCDIYCEFFKVHQLFFLVVVKVKTIWGRTD